MRYLRTKHALLELAYHTGLTHLLRSKWPAGRNDGTILIYHSIGDSIENPLIPSQMRVSPSRFAAQMAYLARRCHVMPLLELGNMIRTGSPLPFRAVALTFDDGFKDNVTQALPVLSRLGLTATFFVVSEWIGAQRLSWLHRLYHMVHMQPAAEVLADFIGECRQLDPPILVDPSAVRSHEPLGALRYLLLNELSAADADAMVDRVWRRRVQMSARDEAGMAARLYMSWEDLDRLRQSGMDVGGHTMTHSKLPRLSRPAVEHEITQSHKVLEQRLGMPIATFSYPFGWPDSFDEACRQALGDAGMQVACALVGGSGRPGRDPLALGRLPMEDMSGAEFALEMTGLPGGLRAARGGLRAVLSRA